MYSEQDARNARERTVQALVATLLVLALGTTCVVLCIIYRYRVLLYAVCALTPSEGPEAVAHLLEQRPDFTAEPLTLPLTSAPPANPEELLAREDEILTLVNEHRAAGANCGGEARPPVEPLSMDPHLRCAARLHSMDMAERDYFSHGTWDESADACSNDGQCASGYTCQPRTSGSTPSRCGKSPSLRVQEVGGPMGAGWENIAAGNSTAADTMNQWMNSTGHCNNIMNGNLRTIGVGYYGGGSFGHYWTQGFDN